MWLNELKELYLEQGGYEPLTPNKPGPVYKLKAADDTNHNYYGMKYAMGNKGGGDFNLFDDAEAKPLAFSAPMGEQEEELDEDKMISKNYVLTLLKQHMERGDSDSVDNATTYHLAQLKNAIKRL